MTTKHDGETVTTNTLDGNAAVYTSWGSEANEESTGDVFQEFMYAENTAADGAYAYIDTRDLSHGMVSDLNHWNNNKDDAELANAICVFKIPSQLNA